MLLNHQTNPLVTLFGRCRSVVCRGEGLKKCYNYFSSNLLEKTLFGPIGSPKLKILEPTIFEFESNLLNFMRPLF